MLKSTLDSNCVIAVEEGRPEAAAVRQLAEAHRRCEADVAIAAIMASEKQRAGGLLEDFWVFQERLLTLDLDHRGLVLPMSN